MTDLNPNTEQTDNCITEPEPGSIVYAPDHLAFRIHEHVSGFVVGAIRKYHADYELPFDSTQIRFAAEEKKPDDTSIANPAYIEDGGIISTALQYFYNNHPETEKRQKVTRLLSQLSLAGYEKVAHLHESETAIRNFKLRFGQDGRMYQTDQA